MAKFRRLNWRNFAEFREMKIEIVKKFVENVIIPFLGSFYVIFSLIMNLDSMTNLIANIIFRKKDIKSYYLILHI